MLCRRRRRYLKDNSQFNTGSLLGRLRGSYRTSTLEPDMGNASVGNVKSENYGRRTYVAFRFFIELKNFNIKEVQNTWHRTKK